MNLNEIKDRIEIVLKHEGENEEPDSTISLKDVISAVLNGKKIVAITIIISLLIAIVASYSLNPYRTSSLSIIEFNFDGIDKGLDPLGQKFDVGKLRSPELITKALQELGLDKEYTADSFRPYLLLEPVVPGDITAKIKKLEEARTDSVRDVQDFTYYPNKYTIKMDISKKVSITTKRATLVLDEIIKQYEKYFYEKYTDRYLIGDQLKDLDFNSYDYAEFSEVIHNQINMLQSYLKAKQQGSEGGVFRSNETGLSFEDIYGSVGVIGSVDVDRMDSIIGAFKLTKNKERLIKLFEYKIKQFELRENKKQDEARKVDNTIKGYKKDKQVILMPGIGDSASTSSSIEVDKQSGFYDTLTQRATDAGVAATNAVHDIQYYKNEIKNFKNDKIPPVEKKKAEKEVDNLAQSITKRLIGWVNLTNKSVQEYYNRRMNNIAIRRLSPVSTIGGLAKSSLLVTLAISSICGLIVGVFLAFAVDFWRRKIKINMSN